MYCLQCRKHTDTIIVEEFTTKSDRQVQRGICSVCGKLKTRFIKSINSGAGLFNTPVKKRPFELRLPGHYFTEPVTNMDKRLNHWSKPINRVDEAAYHQDLCYENMDTRKLGRRFATSYCCRICRTLFYNPSLQEKIERGVILIISKVNLGLVF